MLNEDLEKGICKRSEDKFNIENVVVVYYFSRLFNLSRISENSFQFIERCFPMIVDDTSFLELDFKNMSKVLSSSELNIDSE